WISPAALPSPKPERTLFGPRPERCEGHATRYYHGPLKEFSPRSWRRHGFEQAPNSLKHVMQSEAKDPYFATASTFSRLLLGLKTDIQNPTITQTAPPATDSAP